MAIANEAVQDTGTDAPARAGGSALRTAGIASGLLVMMLATQLAAPIIGCSLLASVTPGCAAPADAPSAGGDALPAAAKGPPVYLAMDPPLVVSLEDKGSIRFLQVAIQLMARDEGTLSEVDALMPIVRNNLLMLFGGQTVSSLTNRDEKEQLRQAVLEEVRNIVRANRLPTKAGRPSPDIEDLYFTSFVVQ